MWVESICWCCCFFLLFWAAKSRRNCSGSEGKLSILSDSKRDFTIFFSVSIYFSLVTKDCVSLVFIECSRLQNSGILFFMEEFQWFLMALSVLPGSMAHNSAHLLPLYLCKRNKIHSSSSAQGLLLISGFKWLCHLSLHYFPILLFKKEKLT